MLSTAEIRRQTRIETLDFRYGNQLEEVSIRVWRRVSVVGRSGFSSELPVRRRQTLPFDTLRYSGHRSTNDRATPGEPCQVATTEVMVKSLLGCRVGRHRVAPLNFRNRKHRRIAAIKSYRA